jgi:hypothetical protein
MDRRQAIAISEFVSDRTPRPLMAPVLTFDFAEEIALLRAEQEYEAHGHNARTLIKHSEFRLVLIALAQGAQIRKHLSTERIALQTLGGRLAVRIPTELVELGSGQLLSLDHHLDYAIEALEASDFLLWLGWSKH